MIPITLPFVLSRTARSRISRSRTPSKNYTTVDLLLSVSYKDIINGSFESFLVQALL